MVTVLGFMEVTVGEEVPGHQQGPLFRLRYLTLSSPSSIQHDRSPERAEYDWPTSSMERVGETGDIMR
jgi:hypothetical protein